jgi:hypothetical protein
MYVSEFTPKSKKSLIKVPTVSGVIADIFSKLMPLDRESDATGGSQSSSWLNWLLNGRFYKIAGITCDCFQFQSSLIGPCLMRQLQSAAE